MTPATRPAISLVIPMFRESQRIGRTVSLLSASPLQESGVELIFVDDGSDDDTVEVLKKSLVRVGLQARLIQLATNQGKGGAVRAGMLEALGAVVVFSDADLSTSPEEILRIAALVEQEGADVVVASRALPDSVIAAHQSRLRQMSGRSFNAALRVLGLTSFDDTQCGLKAFRAGCIPTCFEHLATSGFAFDVEVLLRAKRAGLRVVEVPVLWSHVDDSRVMPLRHGISMLCDAVSIRWRFRRSVEAHQPRVTGLMEAANINAMSVLEDEHWWFRAKRNLVADHIAPGSIDRVLDVGCGTGVVVRTMSESTTTGFGVDLDAFSLALARRADAGSALLGRSRAESLPFRNDSFGALLSLDVIEHLDDDVAGLREYARVVRPGATVVVAVPAYQWAWSQHDVTLGHRRRYTKKQLATALHAANLDVVRITYYHSWLVPAAFLLRRTPVKRLMRGTAEEASFVHPKVNSLLKAVTAVERRAIRRTDLPFGLSVLGVARAPVPSPLGTKG